ncbi:MAG: TlpA disulfide reductase family protein [Eubacteriales bacterium]|nr:TlpA disulfide reductase family protein [Eubacteriales bacterium]
MQKKRQGFLALMLALALMVSGAAFAAAEETPAVYQLGDKVEDFTIAMSDGQEISLYSLLAEKKVVVLNFWASWCGPCRMEFPYLQEVYTKLSADVGMIALSINERDTVEIIENLKAELGVTTVPVGRDIGLSKRFGVKAYPTSVLIDKNGVICLIHEGIVTSPVVLENALQSFLADGYDKPLLLAEMPKLPVTEAAGAEELAAALNAEGSTLEFTSMENDDSLWPFLPAADGKGAVAANAAVVNSTANVFTEFEAKAGDVLLFDVRMSGLEFDDRMLMTTETEMLKLFTGTFDWTTNALRIEKDGTQAIALAYLRSSQSGYDAFCELRNFRLLTGDEAAAYAFPADDAPRTLEGASVTLEAVDADAMKPVYELDADGNDMFGKSIFQVVGADSVRLKLCIGADVNVDLSALVIVKDMTERETLMLSRLEHDDEAYYCTLDLTRGCNVMATFKANVMDTSELGVSASFCASDAKAKEYMIGMMISLMPRMPQDQIDTMGYYQLGYADGTIICDSNDIMAAYEASKADQAPAKPSFTIHFVDEAGTPIPGVMAQICDDSTCSVFPSDENGVVTFEGEDHSYELHVLMAPAGYAAPTDVISLPENGGEVSVMLTAQ